MRRITNWGGWGWGGEGKKLREGGLGTGGEVRRITNWEGGEGKKGGWGSNQHGILDFRITTLKKLLVLGNNLRGFRYGYVIQCF